MSKLQEIFNAITPENIKDIPLLKTAMEVFIANLEENSQIASDISKIYDNKYDVNDSVAVQDAKAKLRKGLLDVYLSSLYRVLSNAQNSETVKAKLDALNITNAPFINDVQRILNDEYFVTNKAFKEKLGTQTSIDYAYNLTKFLESAEHTNDMQLYEIKPFHFKTEGSVLKEMYENIVKPLAHPLGFTYTYNQIIKESLQDLFGVDITYNIYTIEVRNLDGRVHVFSTSNSLDVVKATYIDNRINALTGKAFTEEEFNSLVTVYLNKVPSSFSDSIIDTRVVRSIIFADDTILEQKTNPLHIVYMNHVDYIAELTTQIYDYNNSHWSLYVDYDTDFTFQYSDEINQYTETFNVTNVKENNNGDNGQKYYNLTSGEYAFHVGGDSYKFAPGQDESENTYVDANAINNEITSKFGVTITGKTQIIAPVTVSIKDTYDAEISIGYIIPDGSGNFSTNISTYPFNGNTYTITASVSQFGLTNSFTFSTSGLNDFAPDFGFTEVYDNYEQTSNTLMAKGFGPVGRTVELILTDKLGATSINTGIVDGNGDWEIVLSLALKEAGDYHIDGTIYKPNGKPEFKTFYEADNLRTRIDDTIINANVINYVNGAPDYTGMLDYTVVPSVSSMPGVNSTSSTILKQIGELAIDNTYTPPNIALMQYMLQNGFTDFSQIPKSVILDGAYIEGSDYLNVYQYNLEEEETFINYGRRVYPIDTSDFVIMTSTDYATEEFLAYSRSTTGYYLYTDEAFGDDYYFYSEEPTGDGFYLTTLGDET